MGKNRTTEENISVLELSAEKLYISRLKKERSRLTYLKSKSDANSGYKK